MVLTQPLLTKWLGGYVPPTLRVCAADAGTKLESCAPPQLAERRTRKPISSQHTQQAADGAMLHVHRCASNLATQEASTSRRAPLPAVPRQRCARPARTACRAEERDRQNRGPPVRKDLYQDKYMVRPLVPERSWCVCSGDDVGANVSAGCSSALPTSQCSLASLEATSQGGVWCFVCPQSNQKAVPPCPLACCMPAGSSAAW